MLQSLPPDIIVAFIEFTDSPVDTAYVFTCTCSFLAKVAAHWLAGVHYTPEPFFVNSSYVLTHRTPTTCTTPSMHLRTYIDRRLRFLTSLTRLDINGFNSVVAITNDVMNTLQLSSVKTLKISDCEHLTDLHALLKRTSSLTSLTLDNCPNLTLDFDLPTMCPNLTHLEWRECNCVNNTTKFGHSHLQRLVVSNCFNLTHFHTLVPQGTCTHTLTHVDTSGCLLANINTLQYCQGLTYLDVSRCYKLTDICVAVLRHCPLLTHLDVSRCYELTDVGICSVVEQCTRLTYVNVSYCVYVSTNSVEFVLEQCPHLGTLAMSHCKNVSVHRALDWPRQRRWKSHARPALTHLNIDSCAFDADVCAIAHTCPNLSFISLASCYNLTDQAIGRTLPTLSALTHLDLRYCGEVTDASVAALANCAQLHTISLASCYRVTDTGIEALASHCRALEHIELCGCSKVADNGVMALAKYCSHLKFVDVGFCNFVSDIGVVALAHSCPILQHVDVRFCTRVTDVGIRTVVRKCDALTFLHASGCTLIRDVGDAHSASAYSCASPHPAPTNTSQLSFLNLCHCVNVVHVTALLRQSPMMCCILLRDCKCVTDADVSIIAHCCLLLQKLDLFGCDAVTDLAPIVHRCIYLKLMYVPVNAHFRAVRALAKSLGRDVGLYPEYTD